MIVGKAEAEIHARFMKLVFFTAELGNGVPVIFAATKNGNEAPISTSWVFNKRDVNLSYLNLLHCSPMLYQQLTYQHECNKGLIEALEALHDLHEGTEIATKLDNLVRNLEDVNDKILLTQRAAIEGVDKVADELDQETKARAHNGPNRDPC